MAPPPLQRGGGGTEGTVTTRIGLGTASAWSMASVSIVFVRALYLLKMVRGGSLPGGGLSLVHHPTTVERRAAAMHGASSVAM